MVTITVHATGNLTTTATHTPSGVTLQTDAPADVGGGAASFSPTDLLATALLSCILTTMGLVATKLGVDITGAHGTVEKAMSTEKPRRINLLKIDLDVPVTVDNAARERLEHAAHNCPVHHSLHPDTVVELTIHWA